MLTELEKRYVKMLEDRVEELTTRLSAEEKKKTISISDHEFAIKMIAWELQINSSDKIPSAFRFDANKRKTRAITRVKHLKAIWRNAEIDEQYIKIVKDAIEEFEKAEQI